MSDPIYIEPFDRGAGGTVITRASREGILFGNPALLGLGNAWLRWAGLQTTMKLALDKDKFEAIMKEFEQDTGTSTTNLDVLDNLDFGPGAEFTLSVLNQNGGGGLFVDGGLYARYDSFGNAGIPGGRIVVDAIGGVAVSAALSPIRWLHLGATQKMLYGIEKNIVVTPTSSTEALAEAQDLAGYGEGSGTDVGMLLFFQDFTVDYSLGLTIKNLTPVSFTNDKYPTLPQMRNIGLGITFHTEGNAIHLSAEVNDIDANSGESISRRVHAGARFTLWQTVGISAGLNNYKPSFGLKFDLILFKIGLSYYNRIVGFGASSFERSEGTVTFSMGF